MPKMLTKSNYISGLQCPKLLWYLYNAKDKIAAPDEDQQAVFEQGRQVGELAKGHFPEGVNIPFSWSDTVRETMKALALRKPVFEASLKFENCYARADILVPKGTDKWDLIEVKSSTSVKDENYCDVGFQYYVYTNAGLKIDRCHLMHLNSDYVRDGVLDLDRLFKKNDVTARARAEAAGAVPDNIKGMFKVISAAKPPDKCIGRHCKAPYECPLIDICHEFLPERNVLMLYRKNELAYELIKKGRLKLGDVPSAEVDLTDKNRVQIKCEKTGRPHVSGEKIKEFIKTIEYPAYYMDFETFSSSVPMFDGTKPYSQVPFQFSVHVVAKAGAAPVHHSFLADGNGDPRPEFMASLKKVLGTKGSIIAFNASFEKGRLEECAAAYPKYAKWVASMNKRVVDLIEPFRAFAYYHPLQEGSCSLKKVLPVLTGKSYADMEIGDGGTASREYFRVTFTGDNADKADVRRALEAYCGLDTLGMVEIVERLKEFI